MTGQNAARHRTTNWINPGSDNRGPSGPPDWNWRGLTKGSVALPRIMQADGYRTIHVGKGHFGPRDFDGANPQSIGFDVNIAGGAMGQPGSYYGMQNYGNAGGAVKQASPNAVPGLEKYHGTDTFLTDALALEAKAQVSDAVKADKPFFLYFASYAVHAPFNSDPRFAPHYAGSGKPAAAQAYATLIEGMDKALGDLLDHLEALGVAENTLIFFLGDNGSDAPMVAGGGGEKKSAQPGAHTVACAAPLRGKKGSHYEGGVRVPFIGAWVKPDAANAFQKRLPIAVGGVQTQQAAVYDMFPTILALTGAATPPNHALDGARLDTLLTGKRDSAREEKFLMHYPHSPHRSDYFTTFRDGDWKVIYHYFPSEVSEGSHYQLFNLKADPSELKNLATTEPAELKRMMQGLIAGLEKQNAVYPVDKETKSPLKPVLP
jgi:arylsulfatase A-like enzyme